MRRILFPLAALALLALGACGFIKDKLGVSSEQSVATVTAAYNTALAGFIGYAEEPRCGNAAPTNGALCSDPVVVKAVRDRLQPTYDALVKATDAARDPESDPAKTQKLVDAAKAAVSALRGALIRAGVSLPAAKG